MTKKSGTAGSAIEPMAPASAHEADDADPGAVDEIKAQQAQTHSGKYGSVKAKPFKPADPGGSSPSSAPGASSQPGEEEKKKKTWIEVVLVDAQDNPVAGQRYQITLPDNSVDDGTLDKDGKVRLEGIDPGTCKVTFPGYDGRSWDKGS